MMEQTLSTHRILFLGEEITSGVANRIIEQLLLLDAVDHHAQIDLYINSPGGSVNDGLAIIDTMRCIQAPVSTICVGKAFSMAAWILAAGKSGSRYATPNAQMMIHQIHGGIRGETADIEVHYKQIKQQQAQLIAMLAEWSGQRKTKIHEDIQRYFFLTAKEAKEYGLIDNVLEPFKK